MSLLLLVLQQISPLPRVKIFDTTPIQLLPECSKLSAKEARAKHSILTTLPLRFGSERLGTRHLLATFKVIKVSLNFGIIAGLANTLQHRSKLD